MSPHRQILKRIAAWTAAVLLLLTVYAASYPVNLFCAMNYVPRAMPAVLTVYSPLIAYAERPKQLGLRMSTGSRLNYDFEAWVYGSLSDRLRGDARSNSILDNSSQVDCTGTSLHDITEFLGELHDCPIELDSDVNGKVEITIKSTATLRQILTDLAKPQGLVIWPAKGRIVVGSPAAIRRVRIQDRTDRPVPAGAWILFAMFLASSGTLVLLWRASRRQAAIARPSP